MAFRISEAARHQAYLDQQAEMKRRIVQLRARLAEKAETEGPDSLWAEMLQDHDRRNATN